MLIDYKTILAGIALLFSVQSVQAIPFPIADPSYNAFVDVGSVGFGTTDASVVLEDLDPNAGWFKFTLSNDSNFSLDTIDSFYDDTILALYDMDGNVLDQNDICDDLNGIFTACLSWSGSAGDMFYAGVAEWYLLNEFLDDWTMDIYEGNQDTVALKITVSPIPVPAAVWLFGTALIGFVGMSRRKSIKS